MLNKYFKYLSFVVALMLLACQLEDKQAADWELVFAIDEEAKVVYGSKSELITLVRNGNPIRIGWESMGKTSVEHTIDTRFLTIANEKEVFAQLEPFWGQRPDLRGDTLSITHFASETNWILGTNGRRSSLMVDKSNDTTGTYPPSPFGYPVKWYAKVNH